MNEVSNTKAAIEIMERACRDCRELIQDEPDKAVMVWRCQIELLSAHQQAMERFADLLIEGKGKNDE